jgi:hypothetical protein
MRLNLIVHSERASLAGWRYLWAKRVRGFRPGCHCAGCLTGSYEPAIGLSAPVNRVIELPGYAPGEIIYLCGVSTPYRWANNLHLPIRVTGERDDIASAVCWQGDEITIAGAVRLQFTDEAARRDYPSRGPAFLTCRNFQFGAAMRAGELAR